MHHSIYIGQAGIDIDQSGELRTFVLRRQSDDAPKLVNDNWTGNSNGRHPQRNAWKSFLKEVGLYEFFFDEKVGLMRKEDTCFLLDALDLETIQNALKNRQKYADERGLTPGFHPDGFTSDKKVENVDPHLARLIWLEYWVKWAIANCDIPAIYNI